MSQLGLPDDVSACLFDLDGVLTDTASVHKAAWKHTFDEFLRRRQASEGPDPKGSAVFRPFTDADYAAYVDGKPRQDGVRDFLASRGISLPEGSKDDPPDAATVWGVGNRKNETLVATIERDGVTVYPGSRRYLEAAERAGLGRIVVSSSANTERVLEVTGLAPYVQGRVDGITLAEQHLAGKPAPDSFLAGAELAGRPASACAVFEDAISGVQAGRAAGCYVVGVNRVSSEHAEQLAANGADIVVDDLAELLGPPSGPEPGGPAAVPFATVPLTGEAPTRQAPTGEEGR